MKIRINGGEMIYSEVPSKVQKNKQVRHIVANPTSGVLQLSNHKMRSNLTLGLLLKWLLPCVVDEELTSSGTMAE